MGTSLAKAIFRLPNDTKIYLIEGKITDNQIAIDFNQSKKCFYISLFNNKDNAYCFFSENDSRLTIEDENFDAFKPTDIFENCLSKDDYLTLVEKAKMQMQHNEKFQKVVLARCKTKNISTEINLRKIFDDMCIAYPNAFCYLLSSQITGTWIGASPELLLKKKENEIETVALAGTLMNDGEKWNEKEMNEHRLVELFIENILQKKHCAFSKKEAQTIASGNLKHLMSSYTIENINTINELLSDLNPTPATCGLEKNISLDFISENEKLDRKFYSGFVGVTLNSGTHLFANLRCIHYLGNQIRLYAGAGITKHSIAENEWHETENKMEAIGQFFK